MIPYATLKRAMDVLISALLLVLVSPLLLLTAAAIRFSMGSPILFRQQRPGLGGRPFVILKFRSMRDPVDAAEVDAARLTKLGQILRGTSLDELPELWNVLAGDMSLVGPRPLLMQYLPLYSPRQARRHEVKPGMTGWAQVNGRNSVSWPERFELDVWYVDNQSLLVDLKILFLTFWTVARREGISQEGRATMEPFRGNP